MTCFKKVKKERSTGALFFLRMLRLLNDGNRKGGNSNTKENVIINHYKVLLNYLGWQDAGQIIAAGVWPAGAVNNTDYPRRAYELGKSLG